jgi:hypothetical protein
MTAKNVECIIDPKGKQRSPDLLGGAFQRHFLAKHAPDARSAPAAGH